MDQPLTDRRIDARFPPPEAATTRATLRPGCIVSLVDLSAGGALVQGARPLRPGARVHLQLVTDERTFALSAHVLRCAVWSLDPHHGVTYRGALAFEHRCEWFWGTHTPPIPKPPSSSGVHRRDAHHSAGPVHRHASSHERRSSK